MRSGVSWAQRIRRKNFKGFMLSSCWGGGGGGGRRETKWGIRFGGWGRSEEGRQKK